MQYTKVLLLVCFNQFNSENVQIIFTYSQAISITKIITEVSSHIKETFMHHFIFKKKHKFIYRTFMKGLVSSYSFASHSITKTWFVKSFNLLLTVRGCVLAPYSLNYIYSTYSYCGQYFLRWEMNYIGDKIRNIQKHKNSCSTAKTAASKTIDIFFDISES